MHDISYLGIRPLDWQPLVSSQAFSVWHDQLRLLGTMSETCPWQTDKYNHSMTYILLDIFQPLLQAVWQKSWHVSPYFLWKFQNSLLQHSLDKPTAPLSLIIDTLCWNISVKAFRAFFPQDVISIFGPFLHRNLREYEGHKGSRADQKYAPCQVICLLFFSSSPSLYDLSCLSCLLFPFVVLTLSVHVLCYSSRFFMIFIIFSCFSISFHVWSNESLLHLCDLFYHTSLHSVLIELSIVYRYVSSESLPSSLSPPDYWDGYFSSFCAVLTTFPIATHSTIVRLELVSGWPLVQ